jgi:hypothetical protein
MSDTALLDAPIDLDAPVVGPLVSEICPLSGTSTCPARGTQNCPAC